MQGWELIQHAFGEKIILNNIWFQEETCRILVSQVPLTAEETIELDMDLLACVCHKRKEWIFACIINNLYLNIKFLPQTHVL